MKLTKMPLQNRTYKGTTFSRISFFILLLLCVSMNIEAQDEKMETRSPTTQEEEKMEDDYKAFDVGVHLKNMHLWHGFIVSETPIFATNMEYNSRDKKFTAGIWGAAGFNSIDVTNDNGTPRDPNDDFRVNANYKEVSIYAVYRFSESFFVEAVSHNNFTGVAERGEELNYWSFDRDQNHNFVDLNFGYKPNPKTLLYLATILGGGQKDFVRNSDGTIDNSWTNYLEIRQNLWQKKDYNLDMIVGGAWSFFTDKTFYTEGRGNVINAALALSKKLKIGNHTIPVEVMGMWNPEKKVTVIQLDITLF